jgi:hypothetical protein
LLLGWVLALGSACTSAGSRAEEPLAVPPLEITVTAYAGVPLRGVRAAERAEFVDPDPAHALALDFSLVYVERWPAAAPPGKPLAESARLVVAAPGGEPIDSVSELTYGARELDVTEWRALADAPPADSAIGRTADVRSGRLALANGLTQTLSIARKPSGEGVRTTLAVSRRAEDGAVELAFGLARSEDEHTLAQRETRALASGTAPVRPRRELLLLADPLALGEAHERVFAWPAHVAGIERGAFVARFVLHEAPDAPEELAGHADRLVEALAAACATDAETRERASRSTLDDLRRQERVRALATLALASNRRAALVFLASATGATVCGDVALAADDALLDALVDALASEGAETFAREATTLGWHLERGTWLFLAARMDADTPLSVGMRGLLARHAGDVARSASSIDDVVRASADPRDLAARIVAENAAALGDSDPSTRARAFDWLTSRDAAPAGYDPFGPVGERRRALATQETKLQESKAPETKPAATKSPETKPAASQPSATKP